MLSGGVLEYVTCKKIHDNKSFILTFNNIVASDPHVTLPPADVAHPWQDEMMD
jgi:hypothetical protein